MALSGYVPPPPLPPLSPHLSVFLMYILCRVPLTRQGAACTAIPSLRKCRHPPSITSVSGSCTPPSSYPRADFSVITITVAAFVFSSFPFTSLLPLLPSPQLAFVYYIRCRLALCISVCECFFSSLIIASTQATQRSNIYISVTYHHHP